MSEKFREMGAEVYVEEEKAEAGFGTGGTVRRNAGNLTKEGSWTTKPEKNI
jgi:hypothetical protein